MLYRKIAKEIEDYLQSDTDRIMILEGARQIGKSYIVRDVGKRCFKNFVEINFVEDEEGDNLFKLIHKTEDFYFALSSKFGTKLGDFSNTLIFLDEIQQYPQYLTMLKFLRQERRYRFIASGSMLGIALRNTTSIPVGSIVRKQMYQLDFEEFLWANGVGAAAIAAWRERFVAHKSLNEEQHNYLMGLFRRYLLVGGMPDAVNEYLNTHNIIKVRQVQGSIHQLYGVDASKYEREAGKNLLIRRIYDMVPSQMENKKKRMVAQEIRGQKGDRFARYQEEFEYLVASGITLEVRAVTNPRYPLSESVMKNLLKLYMNDVGMLTAQIYGSNLQPVQEDRRSINLGAVYENVVAQELKAHGYRLFYYDNRQRGEVDFLVGDPNASAVLPIEVKSGKDYSVHSALNNLLTTPDYHIPKGIVFSNNREVFEERAIVYMPIYYVMFLSAEMLQGQDVLF